MEPNKTALVSFWSPTEDLLEAVKEGKVIEIVNAAAGPFIDEIQVTAGRSSSIKPVKMDLQADDKFAAFFRHETKISEINSRFSPPQNEFDVACVVIKVESNAVNGFQKVYVADDEMNVLCLNFCSSIENYAYDDVMIEGRFFYARNLQWRISHATTSQIPQAFAIIDTTSFIVNPKNVVQQQRLEKLEAEIKKDFDFISKCIGKIAGTDDGINKENVNRNKTLPPRATTTLISNRPVFSTTLPSNTTAAASHQTTTKADPSSGSGQKRLGTYGNVLTPIAKKSRTR
jgi:hypothetical protein